ncbi:hypothetical protein Vadar_002774 [Vaccinium darrowii]|uniref:Uncharacterized protein n=1 Tax=Vaccinium darrowii TaxID=229202 RepID=A0ACB7XEX5_9ERIC|nr:hypothetical protein Vadar_002774 [Vaccinium darrowii]
MLKRDGLELPPLSSLSRFWPSIPARLNNALLRVTAAGHNSGGRLRDLPVKPSSRSTGEQNRALVADDDDGAAAGSGGSLSEVALLAEDWRLSQFWYDQDTAETVANEVLSLCGSVECASVACIACPTLYAYLKKIDPSVSAQLLEYDKRFEQYGSEFTFYDYNQPEELPSSMKNAYQIVVADPPYLSKECLEKVARTISFLMRPAKSYLLLLTGEVQKDRAAELLVDRCLGFLHHPNHGVQTVSMVRIIKFCSKMACWSMVGQWKTRCKFELLGRLFSVVRLREDSHTM